MDHCDRGDEVQLANKSKRLLWQPEYPMNPLENFVSGKSSQEATFCSLPLSDTGSKTKQIGISEETYYNILAQLCHTKSVLNILKKTTSKPLMIESWTQTHAPAESTDIVNELKQNCQDLQTRLEKQKLESESLRQENLDLKKRPDRREGLNQVQSEKKIAQENEKKSLAKLKREKELHENTEKKLLEAKNQNIVPAKNNPCFTRCSPKVYAGRILHDLVVDCEEEEEEEEEDIQPFKQCERCHKYFSTNEELEYHHGICQEME
ncbi:unnamed protein product [Acanthosepion pharaonis]|uniref:Uncharacterized protein n=1 Tax=Acanthosepion pharaonis TaxID=158019 RepID=A0A812B3W3_ACAPH|nr:unnamed protein product [Sepia pharaonis]